MCICAAKTLPAVRQQHKHVSHSGEGAAGGGGRKELLVLSGACHLDPLSGNNLGTRSQQCNEPELGNWPKAKLLPCFE